MKRFSCPHAAAITASPRPASGAKRARLLAHDSPAATLSARTLPRQREERARARRESTATNRIVASPGIPPLSLPIQVTVVNFSDIQFVAVHQFQEHMG